jgi:hypothetical protein
MFQYYLDRGYHLDRGYRESQINQPSRYGYEEKGDGFSFIYRDNEGKWEFKVRFTDEEGHAKVVFANGDSGEVQIDEPDEDEDDEEA